MEQQPRAAGAPPEAASSLPLWSSPAQRELPQKQPLLSLYRLIEQPRAAGAPPDEDSSLSQSSSSPAQRELPQPLLPLYRAAPRMHKASRNSLLPLSIEQPRAAGGVSSLPKLLPSSSSGPPSLSHLHLEVREHSVGVRSTDANSRVRLSKEGTAFHMHHSSSFRI